VATPSVADLVAFTGKAASSEQGEAVLSVANAQVRSYVRGVGYADGVPNEELAAVVLYLAARYLAHTGVNMDLTEGPSSVSYRSSPGSFSVSETFTLNRFRVRAL
jgi:hypothetical protein